MLVILNNQPFSFRAGTISQLTQIQLYFFVKNSKIINAGTHKVPVFCFKLNWIQLQDIIYTVLDGIRGIYDKQNFGLL